jgi:hypothetical protein
MQPSRQVQPTRKDKAIGYVHAVPPHVVALISPAQGKEDADCTGVKACIDQRSNFTSHVGET